MGRLGVRLRSLFGRNKPSVDRPSPSPENGQTDQVAERLQRRVRRVSESLLENERLTADLDDSAAQVLLDWGLSLGRQIAQDTAGVQDDEQADQAMSPRLRATRRMMHSVNLWVTSEQEGDRQRSSEALHRIMVHAKVIYGQAFAPPSEEQRSRFLQAQSELLNDPARLIANLRQLFTDRDDARPR